VGGLESHAHRLARIAALQRECSALVLLRKSSACGWNRQKGLQACRVMTHVCTRAHTHTHTHTHACCHTRTHADTNTCWARAQVTRLRYTPRRLAIHPLYNTLFVAEADHAAIPLAEREDVKERLQAEGAMDSDAVQVRLGWAGVWRRLIP